ncbi:MAG: tetratricopeptide repeat protein [Candidatus Riflebacteria bacterium]|nr:tetratricopeptide repeat protein [Candidatus Riflebacteria bacterium]
MMKKNEIAKSVISEHPLSKVAFEERETYLKALAFFGCQEKRIPKYSRLFFQITGEQLGQKKEAIDSALEFAGKGDGKNLTSFLDWLKDQKIAAAFLLDVYCMAYPGWLIDEEERERIISLGKTLELTYQNMVKLELFVYSNIKYDSSVDLNLLGLNSLEKDLEFQENYSLRIKTAATTLPRFGKTNEVIDQAYVVNSGEIVVFTGRLDLKQLLVIREGGSVKINEAQVNATEDGFIQSEGILEIRNSHFFGTWQGIQSRGEKSSLLLENCVFEKNCSSNEFLISIDSKNSKIEHTKFFGCTVRTKNLRDVVEKNLQSEMNQEEEELITKYSASKDEGIDEVEKLLLSNPEDVDLLDWLAFMYYSKNELDKAIQAYNKALKIKPLASNFHFYLANTYFKKGNYQDAISEWSEVVRLNPESKMARKASERINFIRGRKSARNSLVERMTDRVQPACPSCNAKLSEKNLNESSSLCPTCGKVIPRLEQKNYSEGGIVRILEQGAGCIEDCIFENCSPRGIYSNSQISEVLISNSKLKNCGDPNAIGGGILINDFTTLIKCCLFEGCSGIRGGGIAFESSPGKVPVLINESSASSSKKSSKNLTAPSGITIERCIFSKCTAQTDGASIYSGNYAVGKIIFCITARQSDYFFSAEKNSLVTISNCYFTAE